MNTRPVLDSDKGPFALSASFNADNSCFSVALESGFRVFSSKSGDQKIAREIGGGLGQAEMLGTTRYIALVGGGKAPKFPQNKVQIFNDSTQSVSTSLELSAPIQRIRLSQTHIIIALLHSVRIYRMALPPSLIASYETIANPHGLCTLGSSIIAFPGRAVGQVKVYDLATGNVSIIPASTSALRALALSKDCTQIATASEAGTLVRLWSFPSCTKTAELRRGVDPAVILGLAFSPSGTALAVTSDKGTLHIFDLPSGGGSGETGTTSSDHKWRMLSKLPLLPRQFSDTYSNCSTPFSLGDDYTSATAGSSSAGRAESTGNIGIQGVPGGRPTKGLLGWLDESTVLCVGAGQDARWERFVVGYDEGGRRAVWREGWRRYLD
ncbi:WD repeat domain phosphoinositide-interacting protein 4 [Didymella exigua CBS 183.55]|uniref:WD repeat domain phosphoinositide-interacting protein 4 n=1 Tax=Didymella exigua CBS 183.55 TaxID=1150837 RepID=A0A6A5R5X4_9PLEO|nr:WD repeat domain phosphoinositide-interacting protein 4 [Didymella exigua CBS 183.55]KAF1922789.1 WD repeat domain phosphoinositide-interacting protein 4 [Didymella exigua CBS 183.55]